MDDPERARRVALDAVDDIHPPALRDVIADHLDATSTAPAVLTMVSARVVADDVEPEEYRAAVDSAAAGVQLIYDGLRLTRSLVAEDPWAGSADSDTEADVDVLAADVLVARGFRLLANTAAAERAVDTVRAFGREQAGGDPSRASGVRGLEAHAFDLAAVAGAAAVERDASPALRRYAVGLARADGTPPLGDSEDVLPETVEEVGQRVQTAHADDHVAPQSVTDP